ncbi:F-BOX/LRR-REPEAT PROTEIN 13-LIKE [Salix purpurea]|uniref:F-BOX/LRR-REPEAT PROTEIN 13-LIKE n=1 Tax=Salix purpurea TaxID=77065 RepID=A0A9Q0USN5_SALPP|nr:F-BOX/LRR-REPEAT PROTEIN 13-LIKE [Salix purpurea]
MNTGSLNAADRISQLPDDIIHLILSFLSTPEVVRLSVLSKEWNQAYASFPISEFYSPSFADYFDGGFRFAIFAVVSFNGAAINWPSLRELSLNNVQISDQRFINNLSLTCPLIEKFALLECSGLKYLQLSGLRKLKKVTVKSGYSHLEKIEIDVVSLHTFSYSENHNLKTDIDLTSCKNLEVFKLNVYNITEELIQHLNSSFPALKVLVLYGQSLHLHRIEISIPLLEKLKIIVDQMSVEEATFNTPRLRSFICVMHKIPSLFSLNQTSLQEVTLELFAARNYIKHGESFLEVFRGYLKNFNHIKIVTLSICVYSSSVVHKIVSPVSNSGLLDISHLKLEIFTREKESHALVDDLFCICRPQSLLLVSGCGNNDEFRKILCKKLLRMEKRKQDGAATYQNCWQHELEGVKIQICGRNGSYNKVLTCDVFFDSLQTLEPKQKIRFLFEWSFEFCTFVYNSLLRQCRQYRSIPRFKLSVSADLCRSHRYSVQRPLPPRIDELIIRCIEQVTQKGVKELSICFRTPVYYRRLPEAMLSVTELAVCKLAGCLIEGNMNWPSLRVLSLKRVEICGRRIIDNLLFACPFIEELALIECNGIDDLHLSGIVAEKIG